MNREPLRPVSTDEIERYREDGAVCLRGMFDGDWIAALARDVDADMAEPGPMVRINAPAGNPGKFFVDFQLWRRWAACRDFALASPGAAIAAALTGSPTIAYYHDHLLVKEPGTLEPTPWHHDQPYYPVDGDQIVSLWLPLDPVARDTCVEYVKGSHRWGRWFQPRFFKNATSLAVADPRFETTPDVSAERSKYELLGWDLAPGDCIAFHGLTLHGAPGNASLTRRRRAYSTRWLGADTRYAARLGQVSPPIAESEHGLKPGDPMECSLFPRVWPR